MKEFLRKDFVKVDLDTRISEIVGKMLEGEEAVAVFDDEEFVGIISINKLIERDYPPETKAKSVVLKNIPKLNGDETFSEISRLFLESDVKALPVFSNGELEGMVFEHDIIKNSEEYLERSKKAVHDVLHEPITINKYETVGKARKIIRENNISRLPVIDKNGEFVGLIDATDFLKTIVHKDEIGTGDAAGEIIPEHEYPVTTILNPTPVTTKSLSSWKEALDIMRTHEKSYILLIEDKKPTGIITAKDILEVIASLEEERKGVYVQITGLGEVENSFDREKIDKMIESFVQKVGKMFDLIEYLFVHIKSFQTVGGDRMYVIRGRISTPEGLYTSRASSWNPISAVRESLDRLEIQILKDKEKQKDRRKANI
ncbi:MAG: CBS domain-containing protein [Candidatus Aenigmarchaeota archaeon]|nr:CBS domain-containing protein [Candidatus Aenigmarchaeota archaeon]